MHRHILPFLVLAAAGCDHGHSHPHPHPHPHGADPAAENGLPTAQVTTWGDRFEIFLEHEYIQTGNPVRFITHVSDLETLHPRREGKVAFVFRHEGGDSYEHTEDAPARDGIYIPELTFPRTGTWSFTLKIPIDGDTSVVKMPDLSVYGSERELADAPSPEEFEGISFLKEQQWKILTRTDPVAKRKLVRRIRLSGFVRPMPGTRARVTPPVDGRLLPPKDGAPLPSLEEEVKAGDLIARVQPALSDFPARIAEAQAEAARAELAVEQAGIELERVTKLAEADAKSKRELQEAGFALRGAEARLKTAQSLQQAYAQLGLSEGKLPALELRAPIDGHVEDVLAVLGEQVSTGDPVVTIVNPARVLIEARIPEADLGQLSKSRDARFETIADPGRFRPILGEGGGRLVRMGHEVEPHTRTVSLLYEVPNPDEELRLGMAVTVHAETAREEDALAIPASAVVEEDTRPVAYVMLAGETFEKRQLTLGIRDGAWVQVLEGLAEGERVVTKEAFAVRLASLSSVVPAHGHAH